MDYSKISLEKHYEWKGKIEIKSRAEIKSAEDLSVAYTPGVAQPCLAIRDNPELSFELTRRWNTVAVITDGSAILGLGDIGPEAGMPVMEGKCVLFKTFADIDAMPLCIKSKDTDDIVNTIALISGSFGGINLEDIGAPRCFEVERRLKQRLDIPVFHDDQHGTAVVVLAALRNALKLKQMKPGEVRIVISGAGAAGSAICRLLLSAGFEKITMCDINGIINADTTYKSGHLNELAKMTNLEKRKGALADALVGTDIFIGVSAPNLVTKEMIKSMNEKPVIFAMANPKPEIMPEDAKEAGAFIVATGRSDYPNQINNVLAFPGIFRGALDARVSDINEEMKLAAANAIAGLVSEEDLQNGIIIPSALNKRVSNDIAQAVYSAAIESGVSKLHKPSAEN